MLQGALHCAKKSCFLFQVITELMTYDEATRACEQLGGNLGTVHSLKEERFIQELPGAYPVLGWMGLRRSSDDGPLEWADGSTVTFTNWYTGQPSKASLSLAKTKRVKQFAEDFVRGI